MPLNKENILQTLKGIKYPGFTRDIVSFGLVKEVSVDGSIVRVSILLPKPDESLKGQIESAVRKAVLEVPGVSSLDLEINARQAKKADEPKVDKANLPSIEHYIAVASGKGGVGKSTVAVNLALAISKKRQKVGLMDADIWGPSAPIMMGTDANPAVSENQKIFPVEKYGLKMMSIGFLVSEEEAVIWRGPMVHGAVKQFVEDVEWKDTRYLVIDLPPGTGDAQLSLAQTVPLSGGVIVTTPQDVALIDVRRGILMFQKLSIPLIGIIENMSYLDVPGISEHVDIFGRGGGKKIAEKFNVPFLGEIPIDPDIRIGGDTGKPIVESRPDSKAAEAFFHIADQVLKYVEN